MKSSHIFALSLLIISQAALARVTINTQIHAPKEQRSYIMQHDLTEGETSTVDADESTRVSVTLTEQTDETATIIQAIAAKNDAGEYVDTLVTKIQMPYNQDIQFAVNEAPQQTSPEETDSTRAPEPEPETVIIIQITAVNTQ